MRHALQNAVNVSQQFRRLDWKVERRRQLAALPVGENLRMLEEMVAAAKMINATKPPKPINPARARK